MSGGTDNHLFLVNLVARGMTGKDADAALGRVGMTVNRNAVPNDPQSPFVTSGIRIGTPAITTLGFREDDAAATARLICDVLDHAGDVQVEARERDEVAQLCARYPVYQGR